MSTDTEPTTEPTSTPSPSPQGDIEAVAPETQYPCTEPGCDRVFPSPNALQGHKIVHMEPVPCPECGEVQRTRGALGNHRKKMHGVVSANSQKGKGTGKVG